LSVGCVVEIVHLLTLCVQLKFLDVSHLSFVAGLGPKMKEGMVQKRAGGRRVALHCWMCCSCCQPGHWHKRCDLHMYLRLNEMPIYSIKPPTKLLIVVKCVDFCCLAKLRDCLCHLDDFLSISL